MSPEFVDEQLRDGISAALARLAGNPEVAAKDELAPGKHIIKGRPNGVGF